MGPVELDHIQEAGKNWVGWMHSRILAPINGDEGQPGGKEKEAGPVPLNEATDQMRQ